MHPLLNIAVRAARSAGNIITRAFERVDSYEVTQKSRNDFVSEVDLLAEQEIVKVIRKAYPSHAILAEESGLRAGDEYQWIIDPLDGTTNFLHGFPQFAVSIALAYKGKLEHAVIYDPMRQELYTASRGDGARLDERRLRVTRLKGLDGALLGTGFPFRKTEHLDAYLKMFREFTLLTAGVRRPGSAALDLAYVAAGRLDGFWEIGLSPWDMAAGALLIQEAGGLVGDFSGGDEFLSSGNIVGGAPKVYAAILKTITPFLTPGIEK
ncbi:MAG: inositol-1-monophosphatase [Gammaproteobacteria bacterium]|nr:inositol-1-monophosphatase [Gammaproteobacteria bacterium]